MILKKYHTLFFTKIRKDVIKFDILEQCRSQKNDWELFELGLKDRYFKIVLIFFHIP